jgi:hypothetical protein
LGRNPKGQARVSSLQNESDVLQKPRPDKLPEDAKVSLRDAIPAKLLKQLREDGVASKIDRVMAQGNADRQAWLDRQATYLADYDEFLESSAEGPFEGSSSLHLPAPLIVCRLLHSRFLQALLGIEPYFSLKARTEASIDRAAMVSDTMSYALKTWANYNQGVEAVLDDWLWKWVTTGLGYLKLRWDCRYETFVDVVEEDVTDLPKRAVPDANGNPVLVPPPPQKREVEKRVTKKWFEGPVFECVDAEDLLVVGGGGDPQLADSNHHTQAMTADELWTLSDRDVFNEEAVRTVIDAGPDSRNGTVGSDIKQDRATNAGQANIDTDADLDRYEIVESYLNYDVEGSGRTSKIVVWTHRRTKTILRATYLRRINKSGEVPFYRIEFHRRPGQPGPMGAIEMMHSLTKEMDAFHNMKLDAGLIANLPMFFYRASSSINPEILQFEPGAGIPLDNPQTDVNIPNWGNRAGFFAQEEQALYSFIERLFGISDLNMGVMSGQQGATRTAAGVRALLGESNANLDVFLRRLNRGWSPALRGLLHMLQQRIPAGLSFRVTGETGEDYWRHIRSAEDIAGDYDLDLAANSANSNKAVQLEAAQQALQLTSNPLDYQLQIVTPANRYEALKKLYKELGFRDWAKFVTKPQGYEYVLSPQEEINRIIRGQDVPVAPNSDHAGYLAAFEEIINSDELLGRINEEQTVALARQAQKHEQMAQALAAQQAQTANVAQQQINTAQGAQASSAPAANPLVGAAATQGEEPAA